MEKQEFWNEWKGFVAFYGVSNAAEETAREVGKLYFQEFSYLPFKTFIDVLTATKKQHAPAYGKLPSVVQMQQIRGSVVRQSSQDKSGAKPGEPEIPKAIASSNILFAKLIIGAQTTRAQVGLQAAISNYSEAMARFVLSRFKLQQETECSPYWAFNTIEHFNQTMWNVAPEFKEAVDDHLVKLSEEGYASIEEPAEIEPNGDYPQNPDDVPF